VADLRKDAAARRRRLRDHQTASSARHLRKLRLKRAAMMVRSRIRARMHFHRHDLRRVAVAAVGAERYRVEVLRLRTGSHSPYEDGR
jgi:hypothetical protein